MAKLKIVTTSAIEIHNNFPNDEQIVRMALEYLQTRNPLSGIGISFEWHDYPQIEGEHDGPKFGIDVVCEKQHAGAEQMRNWYARAAQFITGAAWALGYKDKIDTY